MIDRRRFLSTLGSGAVALAGCGARLDASDGDSPSEPSPSPRRNRTPDAPCGAPWTGEPDRRFDRASGLGTPLVADGRLFVPSDSGLFALTPELRVEWHQPDALGGVSAHAAGTLVVTSGDGIAAVDAEDGEVRWTFEPPGDHARVTGPSIHDGTVYVGASQFRTPSTDVDEQYGRLYGFDLDTGEPSFVEDLTREGERWVDPRYSIAGASGVFLTLDSGGVVGLDFDGSIRWRRSGDDWYYPPALADGLVIQPRSRDVVALEAEDGETRWRNRVPEMHVAASGGVVYGAGGGGPDDHGTLVALDADTGDARWEATIEGCGGRPVVGSGTAAIPVDCRSGPGRVALFDAAAGCRHGEYEQSAELTPALATGNGRLYASVGDDREELLAFELP